MSEFTVIMSLSDEVDDTLGSNTPCFRVGENSCSLKIIDKGLQINAKFARHPFGKIWLTETKKQNERSAVVCFGWCYKIGSDKNQLTDSELSEFLDEHRKMKVPDFKKYSGNYTILSFDNINKTIWVIPDMWAQMGFFYGYNSKMIVLSSKASIVANYLNADIDGYSYLCLIRSGRVQPGRSLYNDVWRITCGKGIYLDAKSKTAKLVQIGTLFQQPQYSCFKEALDDFVEVVPKVCQKAASFDRTVVDLTAGNDSRITVASLISYHNSDIRNRVTFKVVGSEEDIDVITAKKIAKIYNLRLITQERYLSETDYSASFLNEVILLSDGLFLPDHDLVSGIFREKECWKPYDNLVGSIAGEFNRGDHWRHEMFKIGKSEKVNYNALLKYTLWASNDIDIKRISNNKLSIEEHDFSLLQPYKEIERKYPNITNAYKNDIIGMQRWMDRFPLYWVYSDYRRTLIPYVTSEVASITFQIPWFFRQNRKLVTAAVQKIVPSLCVIPANATQPMLPMSISTFPYYLYDSIVDFYSAFKRHVVRRSRREPNKHSIPSEWLEVLTSCFSLRNSFYEAGVLIDKVRNNNGKNLSLSEYRELTGLLLLNSLTSNFKGIKSEISYAGNDVNFFMDQEVILLA